MIILELPTLIVSIVWYWTKHEEKLQSEEIKRLTSMWTEKFVRNIKCWYFKYHCRDSLFFIFVTSQWRFGDMVSTLGFILPSNHKKYSQRFRTRFYIDIYWSF